MAGFDLLEEELARSSAPFSGKNIACVLKSKKDYYGGHNAEPSLDRSNRIHAEKDALEKMFQVEEQPVIKSITLLGAGRATLFKHVLPCFDCYRFLLPYSSPDTRVYLFTHSPRGFLPMKFGVLMEGYAKRPYSSISASGLTEIASQLRKKTPLREKYLWMISNLAQSGKKNGVHFFLTGSASGRGGAKQCLRTEMDKGFHDIDLVAETSQWDLVEKDVITEFRKYFSNAVMKPKDRVDLERPGVKNIVYSSNGGQVVDLTLCDSVKNGMRQEYLQNNWFVQLS